MTVPPAPPRRPAASLSAVNRLAADLYRLEQEVRLQKTSAQLAHSSIEDGALRVRDGAGNLRASWGKQADGTVATVYTDGPTPGAPAAPVLIAHQLAVVVQWDGSFETGQPPLDLAHVEVHVSERVDDLGWFRPRLTTLVGTLTGGGGALTFAGDNDVHYVCLVAVSTSGKHSPSSDVLSVTPLPADVVMAEELVGKTVTGGLVRTAASGPRVELNANASTQNVRFVSGDDDVAIIAQTDYTDLAGNLLGSGIAMVSAEGLSGHQSLLTLAPDTLGQWVIDSTTGVTLSSIEARSDLAQVRGGDYVVNVGADTGIQLNNAATGYYLWADANGTWRLKGNGDVGGPTGGLLKLFDTVDRGDGLSYFMELDVNEIQSNPYGERLHLNLDSHTGVTLGGAILADRGTLSSTGEVYGTVGSYSVTGTGTVGNTRCLFAANTIQARLSSDVNSYGAFRGNTYQDVSDPAAKADIVPLDAAQALAEVISAPAYTYRLADGYLNGGDDSAHRGLMSTDMPDDVRVHGDASDYEAVKVGGVVATLWAAVQELTQRMEAHGA